MAFPSSVAALDRALAARDYRDATPVQAAVLEPETKGRDLLVSAQTGSGKTVAYGLAIAKTLLGKREAFDPPAEPLALVIAPTRELALQVERELTWLYAEARARIVSCVGGMDPRREMRQLMEGAHIVVGTPGRLRDHLERRRLVVSSLKAVVLDEADEMLDLGFREDLEFILETTPESRRTLLFSATMPPAIAKLAQSFQRDALRIEVAGTEKGHADIEYRAVRVMPREIEHVIVNTLRVHDAASAIVFCNTRDAVRHLQAVLSERGFPVVALSGELSQNERNRALQDLRDGRSRVCVATDVAARGIDLPSLGLVIHADLPNDPEVLQHRSGRTGRAGRKGVSVLLVPSSRRRKAALLMAAAGIEPTWMGPPSADEVRALDRDRLLADPALVEEIGDEDAGLARDLVAAHGAEAIAAALIRMHRARMPAPEDVVDPGFADERPPRLRERRPGEPIVPRKGARDTLSGSGVWFRIDLGRSKGADPKWLLPMLCKRGNVTKQDIGAIKIYPYETKIEIHPDKARDFADAVRAPSADNLKIEPAAMGPDRAERPKRFGAPGPKGQRNAKRAFAGPDRVPGQRAPKPRGSAGAPKRT